MSLYALDIGRFCALAQVPSHAPPWPGAVAIVYDCNPDGREPASIDVGPTVAAIVECLVEGSCTTLVVESASFYAATTNKGALQSQVAWYVVCREILISLRIAVERIRAERALTVLVWLLGYTPCPNIKARLDIETIHPQTWRAQIGAKEPVEERFVRNAVTAFTWIATGVAPKTRGATDRYVREALDRHLGADFVARVVAEARADFRATCGEARWSSSHVCDALGAGLGYVLRRERESAKPAARARVVRPKRSDEERKAADAARPPRGRKVRAPRVPVCKRCHEAHEAPRNRNCERDVGEAAALVEAPRIVAAYSTRRDRRIAA